MRWMQTFAAACLLANAASAQGSGSLSLAGDEVVLQVSAMGVQIYECQGAAGGALAWKFKEPRADLFAGTQRIGQHYAGPTWEHVDGSRIVGHVSSSLPAPQPSDIPWLRLDVVSHAGEGVFSAVSAVQRVMTRGGVKAGTCDAAGSLTEVPYTADYVMLRTVSRP